MNNQFFNTTVRRVISLILALVLLVSFCPVSAQAQEVFPSVPFVIDNNTHFVDLLFEGDVLYCRVDHWAQVVDCLWSFNADMKKVSLYYDTPLIICDFTQEEYIKDGDILWVSLFDAAKKTGVFFSGIESNSIQGMQKRSLAVFYADMERMFKIRSYSIYSLIDSLGAAWYVASTAARSYAILSSGLVSGFIDAASGEMEQDLYDEVFVQLLRIDESLLGALTGFGKELTRLGKAVNMVQKSLDEDGALWGLLQKAGFSESEIQGIMWSAAQGAYGNKYLNNLSDLYEADKVTNFLKIMSAINDFAISIEADAHIIMAIQEVFKGSNSAYIRNAAQKAISIRTDNKALALGKFSLEQVQEYLQDQTLSAIEDAYEEYHDIGSLDKLKVKAITLVYDKALSLTDKSDAIMYSEVHSLIQQELASYFWKHHNDPSSDNGLLMQSVALLYLRSCLASWKLYEFDSTLEQPVSNAKKTLVAEISNVMAYTEEELLQNGTSEECEEAITAFVRSLAEPQQPEEPQPEETLPSVDNSHLSQDALSAYAKMLQSGLMLPMDSGNRVAATHYQILDMDQDALPEIIVYAVKDRVPTFEIYTCRSGAAQLIADSLNTCDLSKWYNAGHFLKIYDLQDVYAYADKSTAMYSDSSSTLLSYDGNVVTKITCYDPSNTEVLIENSIIVGGIQIGSSSDFLTKPSNDIAIDPPTIDAPTTDPLASLNVGDVFNFGTYEQNKSSGADKIQWIILEKSSDQMLVVSKYLMDCQPYHTRNESVIWDNCSVRAWLNDTFYNTAFTATEKERISLTSNTDTSSSDHIFLLSVDEAERYFPTKADRICQATHYAIERDAYVNSSTGGSWWLLRTPGEDNHHVMSVNSDGTIDYEGGKVDSKRGTVRPAMWIKLGSTSGDIDSSTISDGEYYGYLQNWDRKSMTIELYEFEGWNEEYMFREFTETGTTKTLDISHSSIWLEWPWSEDGREIECQSLDEALNTEIWGGGTTVKENCTRMITFNMEDNKVVKIVILYAS